MELCQEAIGIASRGYVISLFALKLTAALAAGSPATIASYTLFNYIANVFEGIFIVHFTQQVQTIEHVAVSLAANGARQMRLFSKIANFGSKILGYVKHAAYWIVLTLYKVLSSVAGPVGMIHPGICGVLDAGAGLAEQMIDQIIMNRYNNPLSQQQIHTVRQLITNDMAYYIQQSKCGGNSANGQLQNEDYQLFIDNDYALVYAANNQIIDSQVSDFALKIAPDGLLTVKNLNVLNFDFVAQIDELINEVNQLQSTVGSIDADIIGIKNDIITMQQELVRRQHFRGYYLLNADIQNLLNSADGDFAFSAESGTVWMYDTGWCISGQIVTDQVSPASDNISMADSGAGVAGIQNNQVRGDHQHPLQVSSILPSADTAHGEAGTATTYARSDHTHQVNLSNDEPLKDSGTRTAGASNIYASATHQHPLNIDPTVANVPLVNATAAANGSSDYYCTNDNVHPQQLTYDGNITAAKFIKTDQMLTGFSDSQEFLPNLQANMLNINNAPFTQNGIMQINPTAINNDDSLRISRSDPNTGNATIQLGCSRTSNIDAIVGQWTIFTPSSSSAVNPQVFILSLASEVGFNTRGLQISAD
ncbi:MAG: hypothetical protein EZS28_010299 [Streblomastix strix]|uniref:Uncharacterized protein n=1 Tax=Streblomastix strix TaxID=222440 RepID=A0A5J4WGK7_9EUKA|nr:MAG: hypothetical protein EZS28_010299 [Streblomastix strix]